MKMNDLRQLLQKIHANADDSCYAAILSNWKETNFDAGEELFELLCSGMSLAAAAAALKINEAAASAILKEYQDRYCSIRDGVYDRLFPVSEFYERCAQMENETDIYFSLNSFYRRKKRSEDVRHINAFCMDFDFYKIKRYQKMTPERFYEDVIKRNLCFLPTAVVDSGRGLYVIYAFKDCSYHMEKLYHAVMKHYLKQFDKYGMDAKAMNTTQVIRLPNTINSKSGRRVRVLELHDTHYTLQEFAKQLPWQYPEVKRYKKRRKQKKPRNDRDLSSRRPYFADYFKDFEKLIRIRNKKGEYKEGGYRETLLWIIREKATWLGYSVEESVQIAKQLNRQFNVPMTESEVEIQCRPSGNRCSCTIDTIIDLLQITVEEQQEMKVLKRRWMKKALYARKKQKILLLNRTVKQQKIMERRARICELKNVRHLRNARIAEIVEVDPATVTRDLRYIRSHPAQFIRKLKDYIDALEDALATKEFRLKTIYKIQKQRSEWLKIAYTALDYMVRTMGVAKN